MKILKRNSKGFTLIELLVVIAIIGILAGIVLINVRSARMKAQDAAIKGNLSTLSAGAELWYDSNSTYPMEYTGFCASADAMRVRNKVGELADEEYCTDAASAWAACGKLNSPVTAGSFWCVDAEGNAKETTSCSAYTTCP